MNRVMKGTETFRTACLTLQVHNAELYVAIDELRAREPGHPHIVRLQQIIAAETLKAREIFEWWSEGVPE